MRQVLVAAPVVGYPWFTIRLRIITNSRCDPVTTRPTFLFADSVEPVSDLIFVQRRDTIRNLQAETLA
jgi:hypothetical protein